MALHGDNKSSEKTDSGSDVNLVQQMTDELQKAYTKAGEEMGRQMAAVVFGIVTDITSCQNLPGVSGWCIKAVPKEIKSIIPADKMEEAEWVLLISPEIGEIPLIRGTLVWSGKLMSGHKILVLE